VRAYMVESCLGKPRTTARSAKLYNIPSGLANSWQFSGLPQEIECLMEESGVPAVQCLPLK
jgi:hypothetical protein